MIYDDSSKKPDNEYFLELKNISKSFPGVKALDNVSLAVRPGEVHALMGENGAGKSTIIKIICSVYKQDAGEVLLRGQNTRFENPSSVFHSGISVVHQERNLIPTFTVGENIMFDRIASAKNKMIDWKEVYTESQKYLNMVGLDISPYQNVESLSAGKKQMIEIARALAFDAKLLILDEPTASISIKEAENLLEMIRRLQKQGMTFIYVSHKIEEVFAIANSVTVLRDGKNACMGLPIGELNRDKLIYLMVGRTENKSGYPVRDLQSNQVALEVRDLRSKNSMKPNSFKLFKGEILGFYGLVGAGRTELMHALIGFDSAVRGDVFIENKPAKIRSVKDALHKYGIVYVSENRQEDGLFLQHDIVSNIAVSIWPQICNKLFFVNKDKECERAAEYVEKLEIKTPGIHQTVNNLSGGNKQKVCIAKGLVVNPKIIIFDEPTVGIDIKTKEEIHELIWQLAQTGNSIIVVSSDLPEVIGLADRILAFKNGQICGELKNSKDYNSNSQQIMDTITTNNVEAG